MTKTQTERWLEGCFIRSDRSNLVDLSHQWYEGMTQPGFFPPMVHESFHTIERDGILCFYNHLLESSGTHCEAPAHVLANAPTIEQIPLASLVGPAVVITVAEKCQSDPDYKLSISDLGAWESRNGRIPNDSWLVMHSGWSDRWDSPAFLNIDEEKKDHYPGFDPAAMEWLVQGGRHIVGIATECMSPEGGTAKRAIGVSPAAREQPSERTTGRRPALPVRKELLPLWNTLVLSNLANVGKLPESGAWISVGVIPFRGGSGGQARVLGILPA